MSVIEGARPPAALRAAIAVTIVVGSLFTWVGLPLLWVWIASHLSDDYPMVYVVALAACPATMAAWGFMLYRLNAVYVSLSPPDERRPAARSAWLRSSSSEARDRRAPASLIDMSMAASVLIAIIAMAVWFFFFAENYGVMPR